MRKLRRNRRAIIPEVTIRWVNSDVGVLIYLEELSVMDGLATQTPVNSEYGEIISSDRLPVLTTVSTEEYGTITNIPSRRIWKAMTFQNELFHVLKR